MPQNENLSNEWKEELGESWKEIHEKYLHTIGNLTLTGYNPELSNKQFKVKRDMEGGFADSPIRLNQSLAKLEHWNEQEILNRARTLVDLAVQIWECPELEEEVLNNYKSIGKEKLEKIYTIEDHPHLVEGEAMRPLFEGLRKRILNLDSSVKEDILKLYIAYKTTTNFVDIVPQKGDVEVGISNFEELDYIMFLIKQAFNTVTEGQV
jgi:predicted transport protein